MITELTERHVTKIGGKFNIPAAKQTGGMVIIKADWCGYCQRALPELNKVSNLTGSGYPIFKIDADKNKNLVNSMGVQGYPTIFFINKSGTVAEKYNGDRTRDAILAEICKKVRVCYR